MKTTLKEFNTKIAPEITKLDLGNTEVRRAVDALYASVNEVVQDERYKYLNDALKSNKELLEELELKAQLRKNIGQLTKAIEDYELDIAPVVTSATMPEVLASVFVKPTPAVEEREGVPEVSKVVPIAKKK